MADQYKVNATDMTAVADAIRAKTGSSASIAFPTGFVDAVGSISVGSKPKLIQMTVNHATLDDVAWGGKTYREIFLSGNKLTTGNMITDNTNGSWTQYSTFPKPTTTTAHYNTSPSSWNCSGTKSVQMYKDLSLTNGNAYYIACKRRLASYTAGGWLGVEVYYIGGAGKVISDTISASSVSETFQTVSHTFTPNTATTRIWVGCGGSANLTGYIDDVVCVNMTELFGSNVPTKDQMNALYETFLSLYKASGGEYYAYGTFADGNGKIIACEVPVENGVTYYVPFDGTDAMVMFVFYPSDYAWAELSVELESQDLAGYELVYGSGVSVYRMNASSPVESDVCDATINLSAECGL